MRSFGSISLCFQLILFDLIGKATHTVVFVMVLESFQLILFDLIGKVTYHGMLLQFQWMKSFQLILFDLIGKVK